MISSKVMEANSASRAFCTRVSLSSKTAWMFFPTGQSVLGFS